MYRLQSADVQSAGQAHVQADVQTAGRLMYSLREESGVMESVTVALSQVGGCKRES